MSNQGKTAGDLYAVVHYPGGPLTVYKFNSHEDRDMWIMDAQKRTAISEGSPTFQMAKRHGLIREFNKEDNANE